MAIPFVTQVADLVGIFTGALLSASVARRREMDVFGFLFLGLAGGLGGGMLRDILIQAGPPLALVNPTYVPTALAGALFASYAPNIGRRFERLLRTLDGLTIGLFAVAGVSRALDAKLPGGTAVLLGVITAVAGGILRDVMVGNAPAVLMPGPFYATAALAVSVVALVLFRFGVESYALVVGAALGAAMHFLSARRGWRLPEPRRAPKDPP
ncbi:MAG: hypothetical protein JWM82_3439 [Myxococcales bacterium]|jgi:uncharacterized membrane protein YeiH|nr:hypothetical protein [Myxococcales bacterium]